MCVTCFSYASQSVSQTIGTVSAFERSLTCSVTRSDDSLMLVFGSLVASFEEGLLSMITADSERSYHLYLTGLLDKQC